MAISGTGLLAGLASAIPGAIQGYQDMKAQDLKKMELEAKAKADAEDRQYKKISAKLKAAELGQDLEENESGELVLKPRAGLLTPEQKRQEEMYMKGFTRDEKGNLKPADWKQREIENRGLLQQQKLQQSQANQDFKTREERQTIIPGYKRDPNVFLDKADISNMRDAASDAQKITQTMAQLQDIVKNASPQELANPLSQVNANVKNLLKDAQLTYKGEAFAKLGVLAGPDMAILDQVLEDPTTATNLARLSLDPKGKENLIKRYQGVLDRINSALSKRLESRGLYKEQNQERGLLSQESQTQAQPQTKVINGVTYRKVDGGWQAD